MILDPKLLNFKDQSKNYGLSTGIAVARESCNLGENQTPTVSLGTKSLAYLATIVKLENNIGALNL